MNDTTETARKEQLAIIFSKTEAERFLMGVEMIDYVRTVVENSIKADQPTISEIDLKVAVFKRYYGREFSKEEISRIEQSMRTYHQKHTLAQ